MSEDTITNCPFCGSNVVAHSLYRMICVRCGSQGPDADTREGQE